MNILLDLNTKLGREHIFKPTIRNVTSHEISNDNAITVVNFATEKNVILKNTKFSHRSVHKYTWT
jgi:hypothetical protein